MLNCHTFYRNISSITESSSLDSVHDKSYMMKCNSITFPSLVSKFIGGKNTNAKLLRVQESAGRLRDAASHQHCASQQAPEPGPWDYRPSLAIIPDFPVLPSGGPGSTESLGTLHKPENTASQCGSFLQGKNSEVVDKPCLFLGVFFHQ